MVKDDLQPPHSGPSRNPVLYGVASGLAKLFPPVETPQRRVRERTSEEKPAHGAGNGARID